LNFGLRVKNGRAQAIVEGEQKDLPGEGQAELVEWLCCFEYQEDKFCGEA